MFKLVLFLGRPGEYTKETDLDPYHDRTSARRVLDSFFVLAHSFRAPPNDGSLRGLENFMRAHISNGTVQSLESALLCAPKMKTYIPWGLEPCSWRPIDAQTYLATTSSIL